MTKRLQNLFIIVGIILIAGLGYYLFTQKDGYSLHNSSVDNQVSAQTAEFLHRLNELKKIELEAKILQDERFIFLKNQSVRVVPVPVGKENPFVMKN